MAFSTQPHETLCKITVGTTDFGVIWFYDSAIPSWEMNVVSKATTEALWQQSHGAILSATTEPKWANMTAFLLWLDGILAKINAILAKLPVGTVSTPTVTDVTNFTQAQSYLAQHLKLEIVNGKLTAKVV